MDILHRVYTYLYRTVSPLVLLLSRQNKMIEKQLTELHAANRALLQRVEALEACMIFMTPPALRYIRHDLDVRHSSYHCQRGGRFSAYKQKQNAHAPRHARRQARQARRGWHGGRQAVARGWPD